MPINVLLSFLRSLFVNEFLLSKMSAPSGVAYPLWFRENVVNATGTIEQIAAQFNCSRSSIVRFRRLNSAGQGLQGGRRQVSSPDARKFLFSAQDVVNMLQFISIYPQVSLAELQSYFLLGFNITVSTSTLCRELKRCGYSRKNINRFSVRRDEAQRIRWWVNGPHLNGVAGVNADMLVDIDESTFTWDSVQSTGTR